MGDADIYCTIIWTQSESFGTIPKKTLTVTHYQDADSISSYDNPVVDAFSYPVIPAGGGTVSPSYTYHQVVHWVSGRTTTLTSSHSLRKTSVMFPSEKELLLFPEEMSSLIFRISKHFIDNRDEKTAVNELFNVHISNKRVTSGIVNLAGSSSTYTVRITLHMSNGAALYRDIIHYS